MNSQFTPFDATSDTAMPESRSGKPLLLTAPPPLTLVGPRHDSRYESAPRAAKVQAYTVRADLDQELMSARQDDLATLLAGYQPEFGVTIDGATSVEFTVTGHDLWQSVLAAMVALTNARCDPTAIQIAGPSR